ncbi:MAG: hypothetical protein AAFN77_21360 [Planctomycetota bacterium]
MYCNKNSSTRLNLRFQRWIVSAIALFAVGLFCSDVSAQVRSNGAQNQSTSSVPTKQVKAKAKIVGFRVTEWKTVHSESEQQAEQMISTLNKLRCEVKTENHGNHIDISYRCPEWRSMKLGTDSLVNQWVMWCGAQGMETVIVNPPANTRKPTVQFRLETPRTVHLHDVEKAKKIVNTLTLIGCAVKTADHDGHLDTTFSCPEWVTIELASEESAHSWQNWLKESGFETKHTHVKE